MKTTQLLVLALMLTVLSSANSQASLKLVYQDLEFFCIMQGLSFDPQITADNVKPYLMKPGIMNFTGEQNKTLELANIVGGYLLTPKKNDDDQIRVSVGTLSGKVYTYVQSIIQVRQTVMNKTAQMAGMENTANQSQADMIIADMYQDPGDRQAFHPNKFLFVVYYYYANEKNPKFETPEKDFVKVKDVETQMDFNSTDFRSLFDEQRSAPYYYLRDATCKITKYERKMEYSFLIYQYIDNTTTFSKEQLMSVSKFVRKLSKQQDIIKLKQPATKVNNTQPQ